MRVLNIIGASIVLIANVYVSFTHSIELFKSGGFSNELAYMGVIGAETTFLLVVLNLVVSKLKGEKVGPPAYAGFYLGVMLILWSNIAAGVSAGVVGIILGAVTPASLIVSEMILTKAILQHQKRKQSSQNKMEKSQPKTPKSEQEISKSNLQTVGENTSQKSKDDPDKLVEIALKLYKDSGKIPSRRSFMEVTNSTEWQARKALENLKEIISKGGEHNQWQSTGHLEVINS